MKDFLYLIVATLACMNLITFVHAVHVENAVTSLVTAFFLGVTTILITKALMK